MQRSFVSAGHVAAHPAVRVRAARRAGAARAALPPPGARAAPAAAPAGQHEPHHQLLRDQAQVHTLVYVLLDNSIDDG